MEAEESERRILEVDMAWLLQKCTVRVLDRVIESTKLMLGVWKMKATCIAVGIEADK